MTKMSLMTDALLMLAQTATPQKPTLAQTIMGFMPMVLLAFAGYFILIAPQRKKLKEQEKMLAALGSGDEIVTSGGIYGTITNVKDDRFIVRIADNTKIEVGKSFVTAVVSKADVVDKK